ncbi:uncharacterized protein TNCV_3458921 [Trichonephila clavipes]|nr:uncharacterized protein TNCV_3458921 [Trichonephila clavipes]
MTSCNHMCCHSCNGSQEPFLYQIMLVHTQQGSLTRLPSSHYHHSLDCWIPRFVTNRAFLGSFGTVSWTAYEFGRTKDAFTATVERDVSGHHTELVCLNARSYCIVHSR